MSYLSQLAVFPALLVALAGMLMLRGENAGKAARRFLLFMLVIVVLFLLALWITMRFITDPFDLPFSQLIALLPPSIIGLLALILLNLKQLAGMSARSRVAVLVMGLAIVVLFSLLWNSRLQLEYLVLPGALVLALGWVLGSRYGWLAMTLSLLSLGLFFWINWRMSHPPDYTNYQRSAVLEVLSFIVYFVLPGLAVVLSGVLVTKGLQPAHNGAEYVGLTRSRWMQRFTFGIAFLLVIYLAYLIFWGSVWDQTSDGLFGVFFSRQAGMIAVGVGMAMTFTLRGKNRLAGLLFILVVPVLLYQAFETGWRVSYHEITERRAARIARALDRYHAREGHYPETLKALTPRDVLWVQQPVIFARERWCYQGGEDFYRLAAFYREYFSTPVSLRVYESIGDPPASPLECEDRLAEMKERYDWTMEDELAMPQPLPTPLPEVEVDFPKTQVHPVMDGATALPGSWSPDSAHFVFGTDPANLTLHFLDGKTGEICTVDGQFARVDRLREHHAWLPDGRLLFVGSNGEMVLLSPCQPGVEQLSDRFPETFTQIGAFAPESGRVLLQSEGAYWILDGRTLSAQLIPEVTPIPYEAHWDRFAWLPGGERLGINRLNGRSGSNEGSTLFLVAGDTGQVEKSLPLADDSGQSAAWIEGLAEQAIIVYGNDLDIIDLSVDPPVTTNVLSDIFGLDINFADELSASGSFVDRDGNGYYLVVRLNHPRNQATYLYSSETGRVHVYDHEHHTLLLFPDGQMVAMEKWENVPTYRDEYDIVRVDAPEAVQPRLVLTGHTPREYPHLSIRYLAATSQIAVGSAQGVSLVSLPDGEMVAYWDLPGPGYSPWLVAAPDGSSIVAAKDFGGLYFLLFGNQTHR
jgi:hypothetical protein